MRNNDKNVKLNKYISRNICKYKPDRSRKSAKFTVVKVVQSVIVNDDQQDATILIYLFYS